MTASWRASYSTGDWTAIAGSRTWLLGDLAPAAPVTARCWTLLGDGADCLQILAVLLDSGLARLPSFALVGLMDDEVVVFVRGRASAVVDGTRVKAADVVTWAEHRIGTSTTEILLEAEDASSEGASLPLSAGVVRSGLLRLQRVASVPHGQPSGAPALPQGERAPSDEHVIERKNPLRQVSASSVQATDPPTTEGHDGPAKGATLPARDFEVFAEPPEPEPPETEPQEPDALEPGADRTEVATGATDVRPVAGGSPYADLFGVTVQRSVEEAAIRHVDPASDGVEPSEREAAPTLPAPPVLTSPVSAPLPTRPVAAPVPTSGLRRPPSTGMIDHVPGSADLAPVDPAPADPAPAHPPRSASMLRDPGAGGGPAPSLGAGDVEAPAAGHLGPEMTGMTIDRSTHAALIAQAASSPAVIGPVVQAVRCARGHANPAHAARCRACDAPIAEQEPITMPRPTLGVLRLSTKDLILLDRPVVMGRGPKPGQLVGGEHANVVRLPSPEQDISRSHLEIRLDGWHVTVTDLGSTNGTVIALEGRSPERLRPNQPATIEPGALVTLAEEISFRYEVAP